eukprot:scaffold3504_cov240-Pinguiococcus_pyrenoidosus.AAC.11
MPRKLAIACSRTPGASIRHIGTCGSSSSRFAIPSAVSAPHISCTGNSPRAMAKNIRDPPFGPGLYSKTLRRPQAAELAHHTGTGPRDTARRTFLRSQQLLGLRTPQRCRACDTKGIAASRVLTVAWDAPESVDSCSRSPRREGSRVAYWAGYARSSGLARAGSHSICGRSPPWPSPRRAAPRHS